MATATWDGQKLSLYDAENPKVRARLIHGHSPHRALEFQPFGGYPVEALAIIGNPQHTDKVLELMEMEGDRVKDFYRMTYQTGILSIDVWFHLMVITKQAVHRIQVDAGMKYCAFHVNGIDEPAAIGDSAMLASVLMRQGVPGALAAASSALDDPNCRVCQRVKTLDLTDGVTYPWGDTEFHGEYSIACQILESSKAAKGWFRPDTSRE